VKVKVGPIQVTYAGTARFTVKDEAARRAVIEASAKEARGNGTAKATITAQLHDAGGTSTDVTVSTDLAITGRPAQFGRGVMAEVGNKLLGRFADCLAGELGSDPAVVAQPAPAPVPEPSPEPRPAPAPVPTPAPTPSSAPAASAPRTPSPPRIPPPPTPLRRPADDEAIDLLETAGFPVLKRLAPLIGGLIVLLVLWRLLRRR
jgi:carbon monoxide dehydrogenase subunit G